MVVSVYLMTVSAYFIQLMLISRRYICIFYDGICLYFIVMVSAYFMKVSAYFMTVSAYCNLLIVTVSANFMAVYIWVFNGISVFHDGIFIYFMINQNQRSSESTAEQPF